VKLLVEDIKSSPTEIHFAEAVQGVNRILERDGKAEFCLLVPPQVSATHWRSGKDLFFVGTITGELTGQCARCLEEYSFALIRQFSVTLTPQHAAGRERELSYEELESSLYTGDEIDLSALIQEQILLTLPSRPLCSEDCKGLCIQCGANLNLQSCECRPLWKDTRLALLSTLRVAPAGTAK
jgi:uncharacterized protein